MTASPLPSRSGLLRTALFRLVAGLLLMGLLVFLPAGTLRYWQGWLCLAVLLLPIAVYGILLLVKDPGMMQRRMQLRESQSRQKTAIAAISLVMIAIFVLSGLDHRFGWSAVPAWLVILAALLILAGYLLFGLTIRANRFAARTVEVQQGQSVISSGPYGLVRHPMYLAMTLIFGLTPLVLGSYWGLLAAVFFPLLLALRIQNEEQLLREGLPGYDEYTRRVRYRLIPFIW